MLLLAQVEVNSEAGPFGVGVEGVDNARIALAGSRVLARFGARRGLIL
jgi:hypothetical protein